LFSQLIGIVSNEWNDSVKKQLGGLIGK
jgi:hypothetical protein